jgi:hypothetical protein
MTEKPQWPAVVAGVLLAVLVDIVGLMFGMGFGLYLGEQVAAPLLPLMVLLGQVAAIALTAFLLRKRRALLKGVYIGGALMLLLASVCVGFIFTLS